MVTLLESKLNSLPIEITSKYPELGHAYIPEVKPDVNLNLNLDNSNNKSKSQQQENKTKLQEEEAPVIEKKEEVVAEDPIAIFNAFIEENPEYETFYKMVKFKIPIMAVEQKATREGVDIVMVRVKHINHYKIRKSLSYIKKHIHLTIKLITSILSQFL